MLPGLRDSHFTRRTFLPCTEVISGHGHLHETHSEPIFQTEFYFPMFRSSGAEDMVKSLSRNILDDIHSKIIFITSLYKADSMAREEEDAYICTELGSPFTGDNPLGTCWSAPAAGIDVESCSLDMGSLLQPPVTSSFQPAGATFLSWSLSIHQPGRSSYNNIELAFPLLNLSGLPMAGTQSRMCTTMGVCVDSCPLNFHPMTGTVSFFLPFELLPPWNVLLKCTPC